MEDNKQDLAKMMHSLFLLGFSKGALAVVDLGEEFENGATKDSKFVQNLGEQAYAEAMIEWIKRAKEASDV